MELMENWLYIFIFLPKVTVILFHYYYYYYFIFFFPPVYMIKITFTRCKTKN